MAVGVQPHTFAAPPPPQLFGLAHTPQSRVPPQPSETAPQFLPSLAHVVIVQPQTFGVPLPPQICGTVQPGQRRTVPQPSLTSPHLPAQVCGMHGFIPHLFGPSPPQFGPAALVAHVPQSYEFPQPSGTVPQFAPRAAQFFG